MQGPPHEVACCSGPTWRETLAVQRALAGLAQMVLSRPSSSGPATRTSTLRPLLRRAPALIAAACLSFSASAMQPAATSLAESLADALLCPRHAQLLMSGTKPVTCVFYDAPGRMLWLGHADGLVSAFAIGRTTGPSCDAQHVVHWQAHRMGAVTAIVRTAAGGLWTGTSRGSLRMWAPEARQAAGGGPAVSSASDIAASARELRRPHGAKPHNSGVAFLVAPATGQVGQSANQGQQVACVNVACQAL